MRRFVYLAKSPDAMRTVERNGKTYEQNTANIGKAKRKNALRHSPEFLGE